MIGALHPGRRPVATEFWIVVMSLVSLVTREEVRKVNIGERKALELLIFRFPQLRSQALAADGRIAGAAHAEKQRDHSADNHQSPPLKDYRAVPRRDSHVDDVRHDHGNDQLKDTF